MSSEPQPARPTTPVLLAGLLIGLFCLVAAVYAFHDWLLSWPALVTFGIGSFSFGGRLTRVLRELTSADDDVESDDENEGPELDDAEEGPPIDDAETRRLVAQLDKHKWAVDLRIDRARSLNAADAAWFWQAASSDPFCKVQLGQQIRRSKTVYRDLNPEWNQTFELASSSLRQALRITVFDADLSSKDDRLGYCELPLWRMLQPAHVEWAEMYEHSLTGAKAVIGDTQPPAELAKKHAGASESVWHPLYHKRGGKLTKQEIKLAVKLRLVLPTQPPTQGQRSGGMGGIVLGAQERIAGGGDEGPMRRSSAGTATRQGGVGGYLLSSAVSSGLGMMQGNIRHRSAAAAHAAAGVSGMETVNEDELSPSAMDGSMLAPFEDHQSEEEWENLSDGSASSTGSAYSLHRVGSYVGPGGAREDGYGDDSEFVDHRGRDLANEGVETGQGGELPSVPQLGDECSVSKGNISLNLTLTDLCGFGTERRGLRKRLEAEWYVKLRLMRPSGKSWILVDKPFRTEYQRALPKAATGKGGVSTVNSDVVGIHMQFKFGRAGCTPMDQSLLETGVLRFKLKCKRLLKFRTAAKSYVDLQLRQFIDETAPGGVVNEVITNRHGSLICMSLPCHTPRAPWATLFAA